MYCIYIYIGVIFENSVFYRLQDDYIYTYIYIYIYIYREFSFHGTVACQEMKLKELKNGRLAAGMKHVSDVSGKLSGLDIEKPMVPPIESALESALFIVAFPEQRPNLLAKVLDLFVSTSCSPTREVVPVVPVEV